MKKNKMIINQCPNFYKIVNFAFLEDDVITQKLIQIYNNFVFSIDEKSRDDLRMAAQLDFVINKYIEDYYFRKEMQRGMQEFEKYQSDDATRSIVKGVLNCFDRYEVSYTRTIYFARWI